MQKNMIYPFSAIVGWNKIKLALILKATNPQICWTLPRGEKGTSKSLVVPALANLLAKVDAIADYHFQCGPTRSKYLRYVCSAKTGRRKL